MNKLAEKLNIATDVIVNDDDNFIQLPATKPPQTTQPSTEVKVRSEGGEESLGTVTKKNIKTDYTLARKTLRKVLKNSTEVFESAVCLAKESESPRSFEALSVLMKTITDTSRELVRLSDEMNKISQYDDQQKEGTDLVGQGGVVNNNTLIVASTEEIFSRIINGTREKKISEEN